MIKDLVVNIGGGDTKDVTADYAISMGKAHGAHVVGVAFVYEPVIPGSLLGGIPTDLIEVQREENAKAAQTAVANFEAAAKAAGVSAETRLLDASIAGASDLFGRIARRFDIAVVWLDESLKLVDVRLAKQWRPAYLPAKAAKYILETHVDRLKDFQPGDQMSLEPCEN